MNLDEMKKIAAARKSKGEWSVDGDSITMEVSDDAYTTVEFYNDSNARFVAMAADKIDRLLAVVEAAKRCHEFSKRVFLSPMALIEAEYCVNAYIKALEELERE